jgi:CRP-like cAMP-binding protein
VVRELESAHERELSVQIMSQRTGVRTRRLPPGAILTEQGQSGEDLHVLLDGVLRVDVDGSLVAELGPGAILGERSGLEDRRRTATLRSLTSCTIAITTPTAVNQDSLSRIADHTAEKLGKALEPNPQA